VIGSEARGVSIPLQQDAKAVRIRTRGVESLNASIAAAVLLYEASRQRAESGRGAHDSSSADCRIAGKASP
jgi:tRNA G18 (ribose-2'-O)-methylase SpoU